jgi:hypothetical protein
LEILQTEEFGDCILGVWVIAPRIISGLMTIVWAGNQVQSLAQHWSSTALDLSKKNALELMKSREYVDQNSRVLMKKLFKIRKKTGPWDMCAFPSQNMLQAADFSSDSIGELLSQTFFLGSRYRIAAAVPVGG